MKLLLFLVSIGILICPAAISQPHFGPPRPNVATPADRTAGAAFNMHWMQFTDSGFSPLRYNGPGGTFRIFSVVDRGHLRRHFAIGGKADYLWNRLGFDSWYLQPEIGGGLTFPVDALSTDQGISHAGGNISATYRVYRFMNEDPGHIYWTTSYTLDFHYIFDYEFDRDKNFVAVLNIPLAGAVSRPAEERNQTFQFPGFSQYFMRIHENTGFVTLDKMQAANIRLSYDITRSRRRSFSIGYEVDFARFAHPEPVMYFSNSLFFRLNFYRFFW